MTAAYSKASAPATSPGHTNPQLFGFDATERLVAVEFSDPDGAEISQRQKDGSTTMRRENFSPFFWSADGGERVSGSLSLKPLVKSPDWPAHLEARSRQKGRVTFALSDPAQQFLTQSGRTLFKGMEAEELNRLQRDIENTTTEGFDFSSAERDAITAIFATGMIFDAWHCGSPPTIRPRISPSIPLRRASPKCSPKGSKSNSTGTIRSGSAARPKSLTDFSLILPTRETFLQVDARSTPLPNLRSGPRYLAASMIRIVSAST
jgi:hypothetical protein